MSDVDSGDEFELYKERLEIVMDAGSFAWWEMELPSGKIDRSVKKAEMLGYSPENFNHYEDFTELIHPDDYEEVMQAMRNHIEGKKDRYEAEYRIQKKNGEYIWVQDFGRITERDDQGEPIKVTGIFMDITNLKDAQEKEEELRENLEKSVNLYRNLLNTISDPVVVYDLDGSILEFNQSAVDFYGYSEKELNSKNVKEFISPSTNQDIEKTINKIKENGDLVYETIDKIKSDEEIPVEVHSKITKFKDKKAIISVVRDISNRKEFQRREFLYSLLRQDMNNKLQTSTGYLQLVGDDLTKENKKYVNKAININKEGQKLVEILTKVNKSDKEPIKLLDIIEILDKACKKYEKLCEERNIKITKNLEEINNKVKGGTTLKSIIPMLIRTRVEKSEATQIKITGKENEQNIIIKIEDDGQVIPKPIRKKFSKDIYTGETSGMGGPIFFAAREILKNYNGKIEFKRSNLEGARLDIHLQK